MPGHRSKEKENTEKLKEREFCFHFLLFVLILSTHPSLLTISSFFSYLRQLLSLVPLLSLSRKGKVNLYQFRQPYRQPLSLRLCRRLRWPMAVILTANSSTSLP